MNRVIDYGTHVISDIWMHEISENIFNDFSYIRNLLVDAAKEMKATVLFVNDHCFENNGYTCIVGLAESHISIHTWPEHNFMAIDIYTCGKCNPLDGLRYIEKNLEKHCGKLEVKLSVLKRGKT